MSEFTSINLRKVPPALKARLKSESSRCGVGIEEYCLALLRAGLHAGLTVERRDGGVVVLVRNLPEPMGPPMHVDLPDNKVAVSLHQPFIDLPVFNSTDGSVHLPARREGMTPIRVEVGERLVDALERVADDPFALVKGSGPLGGEVLAIESGATNMRRQSTTAIECEHYERQLTSRPAHDPTCTCSICALRKKAGGAK